MGKTHSEKQLNSVIFHCQNERLARHLNTLLWGLLVVSFAVRQTPTNHIRLVLVVDGRIQSTWELNFNHGRPRWVEMSYIYIHTLKIFPRFTDSNHPTEIRNIIDKSTLHFSRFLAVKQKFLGEPPLFSVVFLPQATRMNALYGFLCLGKFQGWKNTENCRDLKPWGRINDEPIPPRRNPWDERYIYLHENHTFTIKNNQTWGKYTTHGWKTGILHSLFSDGFLVSKNMNYFGREILTVMESFG